MKRLMCKVLGHEIEPVREVGRVARPGGVLPSIDGMVAYEPHPDGNRLACRRCRTVLERPTNDRRVNVTISGVYAVTGEHGFLRINVGPEPMVIDPDARNVTVTDVGDEA